MADLIREHLQLALTQINYQKECWIAKQNFDNAAGFRDAGDLIKKALAKLPPLIIEEPEETETTNKP